jgi:hypothetical protein
MQSPEFVPLARTLNVRVWDAMADSPIHLSSSCSDDMTLSTFEDAFERVLRIREIGVHKNQLSLALSLWAVSISAPFDPSSHRQTTVRTSTHLFCVCMCGKQK